MSSATTLANNAKYATLSLLLALTSTTALSESKSKPQDVRAERHRFIVAANEQLEKEVADTQAEMHSRGSRPVLTAKGSLVPFGDWDYYFVNGSISWEPNLPTQPKGVEVPQYFVTDLTSIPRVFWQVLKPEGRHAYAAVVHDFLYWEQARTREEVDLIFKIALEDSGVNPKTVSVLYFAVRKFGANAWKQNARLKKQGERRVLMQRPTNIFARWEDWRKLPGVFDTPAQDVEVPPLRQVRPSTQ